MFYVFVVVVAVYYVVGYRLTALAFRHYARRDKRPGHRYDAPNFTDLYRAMNFSTEGQAARRRALQWWWGGLAVVVAALVVTARG